MEEIERAQALEVSISVVSHAQIGMAVKLMQDIETHCKDTALELILTLNLEEELPFDANNFAFPVRVIRNTAPMGFAANHNQAFAHASGRYFCVINPDIRVPVNPFISLLACLKDSSVGVSAPLVLGEGGEMEDSARRFPTPFKILCKAFGRCMGGDYTVSDMHTPIHPDWVGGMFMLFPRVVFKRLGGFDQRYFLYYEDVDLCARLRLLSYEVVLCPQASVVHHAQRSSHRNFRYLRWHLKSMTRFFLSPVYWRLQCRK